MMARTFRFLGMLVAFGLLLLPCTPSLAVAQISSASNVDTVRSNDASLTNAGFKFIENVGQFDRAALFQVRGAGGTWWIAGDAIWITVVKPVMLTTPADRLASPGRTLAIEKDDHPQPSRGVNLKLTFPGSNPHSHIEPFDRLDTHVSYFTGGDRAKWRSDVPVWGGLRYLDLYPGIDLELTGESGQMAPRLITRPGASVNRVNLRIEGADAVVVDGGVLRASTVVGEGALPLLLANRARQTATVQPRGTQVFEVAAPFADATARPAASATSAGAGRAVERGRSLAGGSPGRASGVSDLLYATFLGGSGAEQGAAIAADGSGSAYVAGYTGSIEFPTTPGAFDTGHNGGDIDAFVVKLNPTGSAPVYATFLGGSNWDQANAIAVDGAGSAYVTGCTGSTDFPTTPGAFDTSFNGLEDAVVVKLTRPAAAWPTPPFWAEEVTTVAAAWPWMGRAAPT